MTREELLQIAKPILFNTPMTIAILENRKGATRWVIKPKYSNTHFMFRTDKYGTEFVEMQNQVEGETFGKNPDGSTWHKIVGYIVRKPRYKVGDYLYVRETWKPAKKGFFYKADWERDGIGDIGKWKPSIHMPKEAARIFLEVTNLWPERVQDITEKQAKQEGIQEPYIASNTGYETEMRGQFKDLWDSTIKKADLDKYGWDANPWVFAYQFEREVPDDL